MAARQLALGAALGAAATAAACYAATPTVPAAFAPAPPPPRVPQFDPPYTAVIFSSLRRTAAASADDGYGAMGAEMAALAAQQPGYLGVEVTTQAACRRLRLMDRLLTGCW